ncbi:MAG: hypothetical protein EOT04_02255 [Candidatus Chaera renei]|uniref:Uncharacterized protein n=1 Tax=Candidatus Chaera renei TaxID=2506947 RepID=A0A4V1J7K6_9BACT|nr:MAG: hypothetical protein EOT04_02255 [Candidatus Chaera renei]
MESTISNKAASAVRLLISLALLAASGWIIFNRQFVLDQLSLLGYRPGSAVTALAANDTMTSAGQRYFFVSRPKIESRDQFNQNCTGGSEQTIILGCYVGQRIYIFNVTDPRLPGVKEVTAAHEMLHAAYDRLPAAERQKVDAMILRQVKQTSDKRILELIASYQKSEPTQLVNEMHSIFATEVRSLSPELESYYSRYFSDRLRVVSYSEGYEKVFTDLRAQQDRLLTELNRLNAEIKSRSDSLNSQISQLNADISAFNQRARSGGFASQDEFNRARAALASRQRALQAERDAINNLIAQFNAKRQELLALNVQAQSLNQSLSSTPQAVPTVQ